MGARGRPSTGGYRTVTVRELALNPLTVPFTHGTGSAPNCVQAVADVRAATTTRAWKRVARDRRGTAYVNAPELPAETVARRRSAARPVAPKMLTRVATP